MRISTLSLMLVGCIQLTGCTIELGRYPVLSTKEIDYQNVDIAQCEQYPGAVGEDTSFWSLGTSLEGAVDKALAQHDGDFLMDAVVYKESFPLLYGGYIVKGTAVKLPSQDKPGKR